MSFSGEFVTGIDLVDIFLWAFVLFFFGLVFYLHRESHREGYPLESDETGRPESAGVFWMPPKKTYILPNGRGTLQVPPGEGDKRPLALERTAPWAGSPYRPTGDPMRDGVGPASYAERADVPDLTDDGRPRIAPFRAGGGYDVAKNDADPRGMTVYGADGQPGGVVTDLWLDRSEASIRYLEVDTGSPEAAGHILLPITFAKINRARRRVEVDAIYGHHFAHVPGLKNPEEVTRLEEDKITGYYGGGKLYASPSRIEPFA
ncbi:MAG: photosynthetic reaction center subunit H [Parvularcula sp.]|jgi:photosynthetic reaction center H subunit|nr:photosynthetic reaction center subunit H [Parvularcula sp.]